MAFPVPSHLPRKAVSQDISSRVLSKISSASSKALDADLAASWVAELDEAILASKSKIHERIYSDLPLFEEQLASSRAVQERLAALTSSVNELSNAVSHPESGTISTVLRALSAHASLSQQTQDTETTCDAMEHLLRCRKEYDSLISLANEGRLAEAVEISPQLQDLLDAAPPALMEAEVFSHLKVAFRTSRNHIEEQLNDAYARSLVLSQRELTIRPSVQVHDSMSVISLSSILSSLSAISLSNHFAVLRRDICAYYIDRLLAQPMSLTHSSTKGSSGITSETLSFRPSSSAAENLSTRLKNVASVLDFLDAHLFAALPSSHAASFKKSLCRPITTALLQQFLVLLLPSSLAALPPYLRLVTQAKESEEKYIVGMLGQDPRDREIETWADAVSSHYERKRRAQILDDARQMILRQDDGVQVRVEVEIPNLPATPLASPAPASQGSGSGSEGVADVSDDAWGLEGEESGDTNDLASATEDAWGFDDAQSETELATRDIPPEPALSKDTLTQPEPAADDSAWGWDDSSEDVNRPAATSPQASSSDNSADWDDDPWGDSSNPSPSPPVPAPAPKPASRLEKLAGKAKAKATPPHSPPLVKDSPTTLASSPRHLPAPPRAKKEPPEPVPQVETYAISGRARQLADLMDAILREGGEFASTTIFDSKASVGSQQARGTVILQTAPAVLDLFRALYPVKFTQQPTEPKSIALANDCIYARGRVLNAARQCAVGAKEMLLETADSLEAIGRRWYEQSIEIQRNLVAETLKRAEGFAGTAEQEHYDVCEEAVMGVLSQVRKVARQWKAVLSKSKYFDALGSVVNFCLKCIMDDILALPDITEVESHRLSELCRILHALEGLFIDDPERPSIVVGCVPAWLKFSYLSELLEASLADISYLFDEGALIDYDTQELIKLVRALFADTPQRANMVNKVMAGHSKASLAAAHETGPNARIGAHAAITHLASDT
ncbi:Centromere/kinetochore Zw10-domain-containing protein [Russula earlei]|uniref:Centromere/kinetochore Zw10-domain-containing protein n=1 Tax=Russula earlei TaxID=71964 RepID=A0ACC0U1P1_9AGAM|nr:Centromere/kinetochore Zw10-domain-containing protein [Russula earlei]